MAETFSTTEAIAKMKREIRSIREARTEYERQWLVNIAFLYGKHHFEIDRKPSITSDDRIVWELRDIERKKKVKRVSNYILPLYRSLLSRMMRMKTTITCDATTNDDDDKSAARVAKEALEDFWQTANKNNFYLERKHGTSMINILYRKTVFQLACGCAYLYPHFNPRTRGRAYLQDEIIDDADIGAVEVKVFSPFNVFEPYDGMSVYLRECLSVDRIKDEYGEDVSPMKDETEDVEQRLSQLLDGQGEETGAEEKLAFVYTKLCIPTKDRPKGRMVVFTDDKMLIDEDLPEELVKRIPLFKFGYLDFGFSRYPQSAIEQAVPIQEDLNYTLQRIAEYKKYITGKLLVPRGAKMSAKWSDETGQIIQYNQGFKPDYQQGINPPQYFFEEIERCRRDMEDVIGVHDTSLGKAPSGVKSGKGIENLSELDDSQIAPIVLSDEAQISAFAQTVLEIMQKRYAIKRMLSIAGDNLKAEVNSFLGKDLFGNYRTKISFGSTMPLSMNERREFIMAMLKSGIINPAQARELLEFGDVEGIFTNIDEEQEKEEIQKFVMGQEATDAMGNPFWDFGVNVIAEPWEDHTIRLKVLHDFMKTSDYTKLPATARAKIIEHEKQHQQYLTAEREAAARMTGTPVMPPAPAPAGAR